MTPERALLVQSDPLSELLEFIFTASEGGVLGTLAGPEEVEERNKLGGLHSVSDPSSFLELHDIALAARDVQAFAKEFFQRFERLRYFRKVTTKEPGRIRIPDVVLSFSSLCPVWEATRSLLLPPTSETCENVTQEQGSSNT